MQDIGFRNFDFGLKGKEWTRVCSFFLTLRKKLSYDLGRSYIFKN